MILKTTSQVDYFLKTRFGTIKIGTGPKGLRYLFFEENLQQTIREDILFRNTFAAWLREFQNLKAGERWDSLSPEGTDFQKSVWRELLEIPLGSRVHYGTIAKKIRRPKAFRAIGTAVGANPISLLIPCHRVVPASGGIGNYRWNADRKRALLEWENDPKADLIKLFETT